MSDYFARTAPSNRREELKVKPGQAFFAAPVAKDGSYRSSIRYVFAREGSESRAMNNEGDDWEELRDLWQRLKHSRLSERDVFDDLAQHRIGSSIAREATSSPERVI